MDLSDNGIADVNTIHPKPIRHIIWFLNRDLFTRSIYADFLGCPGDWILLFHGGVEQQRYVRSERFIFINLLFVCLLSMTVIVGGGGGG